MRDEPKPYSFDIDYAAIDKERRGDAIARDKHERRLRQFANEPTAPPTRLSTDAAGTIWAEPRERDEIWDPAADPTETANGIGATALCPSPDAAPPDTLAPDDLEPDDPPEVIDCGMRPLSRTARHDGWTPQRRSAFLQELAATASVSEAARFVAMSRQSARRLYNRDPQFRRGWHAALRRARVVLIETAFERAARGTQVPVWHPEGHLIGYRERHHDGLLIALLHMLGPEPLDWVEGDASSEKKDDGGAALLQTWPIPQK